MISKTHVEPEELLLSVPRVGFETTVVIVTMFPLVAVKVIVRVTISGAVLVVWPMLLVVITN